MTRLPSDGRGLAVLLGVFVFCDILLSPLGFETRGPAILSSAGSLPWFGLLIGGLVLNIASLILLFLKPRFSPILAFVGSLVYLVVLVGDQAGLVTPLRPPPLITDVEVLTSVVLVVALFYAWRLFRRLARA